VSTLALHRDDAYLQSCTAVVDTGLDEGVELDRTVFYPLGGGQAGDVGVLELADGTQIPVIDTRKSKGEGATPDDSLHVLAPDRDCVRCSCREPRYRTHRLPRRYRHMRFHTATHLLCAVVPELVDGCSITATTRAWIFDDRAAGARRRAGGTRATDRGRAPGKLRVDQRR